MPRLDEVALTRRRQLALAKIRNTTAAELARRWSGLDDYGPGRQPRWRAVAAPVLTAGQNRAIDTQIAYLGARLGERIEFTRAELLALADIDLTEPFIALGRALANGRGMRDAVEAGRLRAHGLGESGVQWAARAANAAVENDERIVGWTRTLTGLACEWCRMVATQRYRTADSASFGHQRCDCGVDPIIGDRDPGRAINRDLLATGEA